MKLKFFLIWGTLAVVFLAPVACGRKTAPIPPQALIPAVISDLAYQLDEKGVTLSWSPPSRTEQGSRLSVIDKFLVERAAYDLRDYCESCPVNYDEVAAMAGDGRGQGRAIYREERLRPGYIYFYRVKTGMGWRVVSRPSEPISFRWQLPMAAPVAFQGQAGARQIFLRWQPPGAALNGEPVAEPLSYQLYRRSDDGDFKPLGGAVPGLSYTDQLVENGVSYQYRIRAARSSGGSGILSDRIEVLARDLTPPPPPRGLTGLDTPAGIRLFWEPVVAVDLGGYQIFRRAEDAGAGQVLKEVGRVGAMATSFVDATVGGPATYYYSLKSYDLADPANASSRTDEIKITRNR